jgi:putative flippase GtrA
LIQPYYLRSEGKQLPLKALSGRHRTTLKQVSGYAIVGAFLAPLDFAMLWILLALHITTLVAVTIALFLAAAVQFSLNRHLVFAARNGPLLAQANLWYLILAVNWVVTLLVVEMSMKVLGTNALVGKLLSIALTFPIGFLANRYLTFGRYGHKR